MLFYSYIYKQWMKNEAGFRVSSSACAKRNFGLCQIRREQRVER